MLIVKGDRIDGDEEQFFKGVAMKFRRLARAGNNVHVARITGDFGPARECESQVGAMNPLKIYP
jgi:hypothetical protein